MACLLFFNKKEEKRERERGREKYLEVGFDGVQSFVVVVVFIVTFWLLNIRSVPEELRLFDCTESQTVFFCKDQLLKH